MSGCILGTILANASVPMIPPCCYGNLPSASPHLKNSCCLPTTPHCSAHCSSRIIFPFLLQILNLCCQTVLSLKDMYSLLPGSPLCECLLSLMGISFLVLSSHLLIYIVCFVLTAQSGLHILSSSLPNDVFIADVVVSSTKSLTIVFYNMHIFNPPKIPKMHQFCFAF